jgi:hypothetical protein
MVQTPFSPAFEKEEGKQQDEQKAEFAFKNAAMCRDINHAIHNADQGNGNPTHTKTQYQCNTAKQLYDFSSVSCEDGKGKFHIAQELQKVFNIEEFPSVPANEKAGKHSYDGKSDLFYLRGNEVFRCHAFFAGKIDRAICREVNKA